MYTFHQAQSSSWARNLIAMPDGRVEDSAVLQWLQSCKTAWVRQMDYHSHLGKVQNLFCSSVKEWSCTSKRKQYWINWSTVRCKPRNDSSAGNDSSSHLANSILLACRCSTGNECKINHLSSHSYLVVQLLLQIHVWPTSWNHHIAKPQEWQEKIRIAKMRLDKLHAWL